MNARENPHHGVPELDSIGDADIPDKFYFQIEIVVARSDGTIFSYWKY